MNEPHFPTVVITGAANGLGKSLAAALYAQGYNLALIDVDTAGLERIQQEWMQPGRKISIHPADITSEEAVIRSREAILAVHGRTDMLINNAGISISQAFESIHPEDFNHLLATNFWGTVYCTRHFLPDLKQQPRSRLVNIISDFALMGFPGKTAYCASKGAVMAFTHALKTELTGTTIAVCLVIPPPLDTGLVRNGLHTTPSGRDLEARFLARNGMPLPKAARKIVHQVRKGKFRIVVGPMMTGIDWASRLFPSLLHKLIGRNNQRIDFW